MICNTNDVERIQELKKLGYELTMVEEGQADGANMLFNRIGEPTTGRIEWLTDDGRGVAMLNSLGPIVMFLKDGEKSLQYQWSGMFGEDKIVSGFDINTVRPDHMATWYDIIEHRGTVYVVNYTAAVN